MVFGNARVFRDPQDPASYWCGLLAFYCIKTKKIKNSQSIQIAGLLFPHLLFYNISGGLEGTFNDEINMNNTNCELVIIMSAIFLGGQFVEICFAVY